MAVAVIEVREVGAVVIGVQAAVEVVTEVVVDLVAAGTVAAAVEAVGMEEAVEDIEKILTQNGT